MNKINKLLLDEYPLVVLPELAVAVGLNEAIILQQIHYWTELNKKANKNLHDGYYWTYNTYEAWQEQFPFWSVNTIIRTFEKLIKNQLIITSNYNKLKFDRTKWYRVNYEKLTEISPFTQNDKMDNANLGRTIPKTNFTDTINKKINIVASATAEADETISLTFEKKPKKENIFSKATEQFGEKRCKEALAIIDSFIDELYPKALGRKHPAMNKAQRMAFAVKILDCENETDIDNCNFLTSFKYMLKNFNKSECDPTILYATTPQVLGYWLERTFSDVDFYSLIGTSYSPVESAY